MLSVKLLTMVPTDRYLAKGETLQIRTGPHWIVFLRSIVAAIFILIVATGLAVTAFESTSSHVTLFAALSAGTVAIAFGVLTSANLQRSSQAVIVTDSRIVEIAGVLHHTSSEIRLDAIQRVSVDQSIVGRVLNFGTVTLLTGNDDPMVLKNIAFPLELHQALKDHCRPHGEDIAAGA
jgi:uncharacterized membrane protein YdbT with pleckstrin-like domain